MLCIWYVVMHEKSKGKYFAVVAYLVVHLGYTISGICISIGPIPCTLKFSRFSHMIDGQ